MKTSVVALLLVGANLASGQAPRRRRRNRRHLQTQASPAQPQARKEIKDPAEYNAYVGAVQSRPTPPPKSADWKRSSLNIRTPS